MFVSQPPRLKLIGFDLRFSFSLWIISDYIENYFLFTYHLVCVAIVRAKGFGRESHRTTLAKIIRAVTSVVVLILSLIGLCFAIVSLSSRGCHVIGRHSGMLSVRGRFSMIEMSMIITLVT